MLSRHAAEMFLDLEADVDLSGDESLAEETLDGASRDPVLAKANII